MQRRMERAVFDRMAELDQDHWWFLARRRILKRLIEHKPVPKKKVKAGRKKKLGSVLGT